MTVAASEIFDFIERHGAPTLERHEIASGPFGLLRRSVRKIVLRLRDSDDQEALELSEALRALLSEWLTVPIPFDDSLFGAVTDLLGEANTVEARWGSDIRDLYEAALCGTVELAGIENPVREKLREVIWGLRSQGRTFKVYCHRRARPHFESLLTSPGEAPLSDDIFLHSVTDYRDSEPFEVLLKMGPLRARGWGSAPDALVTAPRFDTLAQIVWSGCGDEPDFGYDPVSPPADATSDLGASPDAGASTVRGLMNWTIRVSRSGNDVGLADGDPDDADELRVFREVTRPQETSEATLVQVDDEHGILYPRLSQVLSFNPNSAEREPIRPRIPGETLLKGMFLIRPLVNDVDLGGLRAEHGHYSQIWKARLEQEWRIDPADLMGRLRAAGLTLVHLGSAIRHWCKPPSTVIHAPQRIKHFEILLRVLGCGIDNRTVDRQRGVSWWQLAWDEVARSRGEAIQAGVLEHEIVQEQLMAILRGLLPQIRENASAHSDFRLAIPAGADMTGDILFFKVCGIEAGIRAPETELKVVRELSAFDQWLE